MNSDTPKTAFTLMLGMAVADGHIDSAERKVLAIAAEKLGIDRVVLDAIFKNPASHIEQALRSLPQDRMEQRSLVRTLALTMAVDGHVDKQELGYLAALASRMSITQSELQLMLADLE